MKYLQTGKAKQGKQQPGYSSLTLSPHSWPFYTLFCCPSPEAPHTGSVPKDKSSFQVVFPHYWRGGCKCQCHACPVPFMILCIFFLLGTDPLKLANVKLIQAHFIFLWVIEACQTMSQTRKKKKILKQYQVLFGFSSINLISRATVSWQTLRETCNWVCFHS